MGFCPSCWGGGWAIVLRKGVGTGETEWVYVCWWATYLWFYCQVWSLAPQGVSASVHLSVCSSGLLGLHLFSKLSHLHLFGLVWPASGQLFFWMAWCALGQQTSRPVGARGTAAGGDWGGIALWGRQRNVSFRSKSREWGRVQLAGRSLSCYSDSCGLRLSSRSLLTIQITNIIFINRGNRYLLNTSQNWFDNAHQHGLSGFFAFQMKKNMCTSGRTHRIADEATSKLLWLRTKKLFLKKSMSAD